MNRRTWIAGITATTLLAASLAACKQEQQGEETGQALPVMVVSSQPIELEETYSASIRGRQDVDIIPQVSGRIIRLCVKEGEQVATGQVLAVIDQTPYQAALRIAIANVSAARAKVETARIELNGKQSLFDEKVISDYELSVARNQLVVAQAELEQAKAQEANARNELSYTEIKSPSNGVIGTLPYRVGALVGPTIEQPFTVVSDNSEMYAYFSISENKLRQFEARYGSIDRIICEMPPISLQLNNGSVYGKQGKIETISGIVNPTTGYGCHPDSHDRHRGTAGQDYRLPPQKRKGRSSLPDRGPPERRQPLRCRAGLVRRRHPHHRRCGAAKGRNDCHT